MGKRKKRKNRINDAALTQPENPARRGDPVWLPTRKAGIKIDYDTALTYSAVWSAVRIISETIGGLSWKLMKRGENGAKEHITGTSLANLLTWPNPEIRAFTMREIMQAWALTWGNAYAEIERDMMKRPVRLWPIPPDRVQTMRDTGNNLAYIVHNQDGSKTEIPAKDMFHIKGLGWDGLTGYSVIAFAARSLGISIAAEEFGASFFGNGASLGGVLQHPGTLDEAGRDNLRKSWQGAYGGTRNTGKTALLEEGMEYKAVGIPPDDAQFLETRKFQVTDVARWFRVPPHKLADLERATFSNIEEQNIDFVQDTVIPWAIRWEQEADAKLVGVQSRSRFYTKLNINSLLRGSIERRYKAYSVGRQWGWLSANDIREKEDMNPLPADQGDVYLSPMNMTPTEKLGEEPAPALPAPDDEQADDTEDEESEGKPFASAYGNAKAGGNPHASYQRIFKDAASRCLNREVNRVKRLPKTVESEQDFASLMLGWYNKHKNYVLEAFTPGVYTMAEQSLGEVPESIDTRLNLFVDKYITDSYQEIAAAFTEGNISSYAERATGEWPGEIANDIIDAMAGLLILEINKGGKDES